MNLPRLSDTTHAVVKTLCDIRTTLKRLASEAEGHMRDELLDTIINLEDVLKALDYNEICPECGETRPDDDRVRAGMKCRYCAY